MAQNKTTSLEHLKTSHELMEELIPIYFNHVGKIYINTSGMY